MFAACSITSMLYLTILAALSAIPSCYALPSPSDLNSTLDTDKNSTDPIHINGTLDATLNNTNLLGHEVSYHDFWTVITDHLNIVKLTQPYFTLRWIQCLSPPNIPPGGPLDTLLHIKMDIIVEDRPNYVPDAGAPSNPTTIYTHTNAQYDPDLWSPPVKAANQSLQGFKPFSFEREPIDLWTENYDLVRARLYPPWNWFLVLCPQWTISHWAAGKIWLVVTGMDGRTWAVQRGGSDVYRVSTPKIDDPIGAAKQLLTDLPARSPNDSEPPSNGGLPDIWPVDR